MNNPLKIAVTGPESTGKSFLCRELAKHYCTAFVAEYARTYFDNLQRDYAEHDILEIAMGQLALEHKMANDMESCAAGTSLLFCDTELIVTKIWSIHKYNRCHPWILEQITKNKYDLRLLCDIDLAWQPDPLREHPHLRKYFFNRYVEELEHYGFTYEIVNGANEQRTKHAIEAISKHYII